MDERLTFYEKQLLQRMARGQGSVKYVFDRFVRLAGPLLSKWADKGGNSVWVGNANIENRIESLLDDLHSELLGVLISSVGDSWKLSNEKTDDLINRYIQGMSISQTLQEKMFARNADAVRDFIRRKDEFGKTISGRVWDVTESAKENLSFYLSSGLSVGRPATLISQDIRQLLNEPDRRFRRVRNAEGKLVPSQPMKDFHPGQGVYRSSYKNALRLAATETNKAYRSADYDRWQQLDFITEIEIMRSPANHGPCSICDSKVGRYPKDFKFTGWHPFCICVAVPVMMDEEEFAEFMSASYSHTENQEYYLRQLVNKAHHYGIDTRRFEDAFKNQSKYKEIVIRSLENEINRYVSNIEKERDTYQAIIEKEKGIRIQKGFETAFVFNRNGEVILNKDGEKRKVEFTNYDVKLMKNAILTHNHPSGWSYQARSIMRIGNSFSSSDINLAVISDLYEIRAVTPEYTFVLRRPDTGWGVSINDLHVAYEEIKDIVQKELNSYVSRMDYNQSSCDRASILHFHKLNKLLSKKFGWHYSKHKN